MDSRFTSEERKKLKEKLDHLEEVCHPSDILIRPTVTFKEKKDFGYLDTLTTYQQARIDPSELQTMWEDQRTLNDRGLGFVKVGNEKWFYDKCGLITPLFSQDGTKKIEIEFPCFMDASDIWKEKETSGCIKKLLEECQKQFPPKKEKIDLFSNKLCQKLYNRSSNPNTRYIAVMEMMETLRRILIEKLINNHPNEIKKTTTYKKFIKEKPEFALGRKDDLINFLRNNKKIIFLLSEKLGYIKKATRMMHYHQMRDYPRHSDTVKEVKVPAQKILDDFYQALKEPQPKYPSASSLSPIYQNYETSFAFNDLLNIENILMDKTDHQFKYNKKDFWQEVERRKVLTKSESKTLQQIVKTGNCVAHANPGAANAKIQLTDNDSSFLTEVLFKLSDFTR